MSLEKFDKQHLKEIEEFEKPRTNKGKFLKEVEKCRLEEKRNILGKLK